MSSGEVDFGRFVFLTAAVMLLLVANTHNSGTSGKEILERLNGTWVNAGSYPSSDRKENGRSKNAFAVYPDVDGIPWFHGMKLVLTSEKYFFYYHRPCDQLSYGYGSFEVKNTWSDQYGNAYCQALCQLVTGSRLYTLWKLHASNRVPEENFYCGGQEEYPEKIVDRDVPVKGFKSKKVSLWYNIYRRR